MVRLLIQVVAAFALFGGSSACDVKVENSGEFSISFLFTNTFSDDSSVRGNTRITAINIRGDKRIDGVTLYAETPGKEPMILKHGGKGGNLRSMSLSGDEYINSVVVFSDNQGDSLRVFYMNVTTNYGRFLENGVPDGRRIRRRASDGYHLVGFQGRDDDEINEVAPIWGNPKGCES